MGLIGFSFIIYLLDRRNLKRTGIKTTGEILELIEEGGRFITYTPLVEIFLANGKSYAAKYSVSTSLKLYEKGQQVKIVYNPKDPSDFIIVD